LKKILRKSGKLFSAEGPGPCKIFLMRDRRGLEKFLMWGRAFFEWERAGRVGRAEEVCGIAGEEGAPVFTCAGRRDFRKMFFEIFL